MSWDIVLFSSQEHITSIADLDENKLVPVNFDKVLLDHFENIIQDDNHVTIVGDDFEIDFFSDDEWVSNKMLSVYGEKALFNLIKLAKKENWQIYDSGLDEMIDLANPSFNGYESFIAYRNQIIRDNG